MVGKAPSINRCDQEGTVSPTGYHFKEQAAIHKPSDPFLALPWLLTTDLINVFERELYLLGPFAFDRCLRLLF